MATADEFTGIRLVAMLAVTRSGLPIDRFSRLVSPSEAAKLLSPPSVKTRDVAAEGKAEGEKENDVHTYAEYFHGDQATKFYFDTERYYNEEPTADVHAGYLEEVHRAMQTIVDVLAEVQPDVAYHVAQRHGGVSKGRYKLSFRTFVDGVSVVYHEILRIMQRHPVLRCTLHLWDATVYKASEQLLCAINGRKSDKDRRVLTPIPWMSAADVDAGVDVDVLHYVASHVDPEWPGPMRCPDDVGSGGHVAVATDVDGDFEGGVADPRILALVALLGEPTASHRPMWLNVAIFLKVADGGGDAYLEAWLDFSAKCKDPHKYYGMSDCIKTWKSLLKEKGGAGGSGGRGGGTGAMRSGGGAGAGGKALTIGTLRHYARCDDPAGYTAWVRGAWSLAISGAPGQQPDRQEDPDESRRIMADAVATRFSTGPLSVVEAADGVSGEFTLEDAEGTKITCGMPGRPFWGREVHRDDQFIGCLHKDVKLQGAMSDVCPLAPSAAVDFVMNHDAEGTATVTSVTPNAPVTFTVHRPQHPDAYVCTAVPGKEKAVKNKESVHRLMNRICDAMDGLDPPGMFNILNINNGVINVIAGGCHQQPARADDELSAAWLQTVASSSEEEKGAFRVIKSSDTGYCYFDPASGLWRRTSCMDVVCNRVLDAMKSVAGGAFFASLNDAERKYVGSIRGGTAVFRRSLNAIIDDRFESRLDANMRLVPFDNGVYDLDARAFRPLRWSDYVSTTIGYPYEADVDPEHVELVDRVLEQVLPDAEERELVLRMAGSSLGGAPVHKKFLVLQDCRGGDNGKSVLLHAFELALGRFCMPSQTSFLAASSRPDPNGHQANTLAYKGKRLAIFDETDPSMKFDLAKLKSITGGATTMAVRGANSSAVTEFQWTALVMIACNKGCLPSIDSSDTAFINRMVPVPMRAKFNDADAAAGIPLSFPMDPSLKDKLANARGAITRVLVDAFGRYEAAGRSFGNLPAGCADLKRRIMSDSDPRLEFVCGVIDKVVDFSPPPRTADDGLRGRKVTCYVERGRILDAVIGADATGITNNVKKSVMKALIDMAMAARERPLKPHTYVGGEQLTNVYNNCSWRGGGA